MVYIIIGFILALIVLYIAGYIVKKKHFTYIDRLEMWKIELLNRPVNEEISKVKQLKMDGEAEECFEKWRNTWEQIESDELPKIENWLYEAEGFVDKYRFSKAKEVYSKIENTLKEAEEKINSTVEQLKRIIDSEEKNRAEILEIQEIYKKLKKELLARSHAFGAAADILQNSIRNAGEKIEQFEQETTGGNYVTARQIVIELRKELEQLNKKMEKIPLFLNECLHEIPNQIKQIRDGTNDMKEEGYHLDHLNIDRELMKIEGQLKAYVQFLENAETEEVEEGIQDIKEQIEVIYDLLEEEVNSKQFVLKNQPLLGESLDKIWNENESLKNEIQLVKETYHLPETEEKSINEIEQRIKTMRKTAELLLSEEQMSAAAFSIIKEKVEEILTSITEIEEKQKAFSDLLKDLRKDELEAREKIQDLRKLFRKTLRQVERSNIPGIPHSTEIYFVEAREAIQDCLARLEEKPLVMSAVQHSLNDAEEKVTAAHDLVTKMIENAYFAEKIIQYGNRYRRKDPEINKRLEDAEAAFRSFDYDRALEEAAAAVEEAEPGAIKRIEEMINEENNMENR